MGSEWVCERCGKTHPAHHSRCTPKCERRAASSRQTSPQSYQHSQQVDAHAHVPPYSAQVTDFQSKDYMGPFAQSATHFPYPHASSDPYGRQASPSPFLGAPSLCPPGGQLIDSRIRELLGRKAQLEHERSINYPD